jgi:hypothetical protein
MKMWKVFRGHSVIAFGLLVSTFLFASLANATLLTPGGSVGTSTITCVGCTLVTDLTSPYSFGAGTDTGSVTEWVVSGDTTNPFGGLDFIYQISVTAGDARTLTFSNYAAVGTTNVGDNTGGSCAVCAGAAAGTLAPDLASSNGLGGISFGSAKFNTGSSSNLLPGVTSYLMYIQTSAKAYVPGSIGILDTVAGNTAGLGPVPEPGSVGLLLGGLFGLGLFVTRRFRAQQS